MANGIATGPWHPKNGLFNLLGQTRAHVADFGEISDVVW